METTSPVATVIPDASLKPEAIASTAEVRSLTPPIDAPLAEELRSLLKDSKVLTPDSDGYADSLKRYAESAEKPAGLVVLASSAQDISKTVLFCKKNALDMAICCGGHATGGMSSSDGGVVIDLSKMRNVAVDQTAMTITAQGGCRWIDVDTAAGEHGLATVGGTVNHTGIGGLTLGGGFGWLTGKHGLAIDNLLAVEVVLANGDIVQASEKENPDLFWAIRGAGANFGVTTSFTYRAHEQKNTVFAGMMAFLPDKLESVVSFLNDMILSSKGEKGAIFGIACPPPFHQPALLTAIFYNGTEEEGRAAFAPLYALQPILDHTATQAYSAVNGMLNGSATHGDRKSAKGSSFTTPVRPAFVRGLFGEFLKLVADTPDATSSVILMEFMNRRKVVEVPQTATAFADRGYYQAVAFDTRWKDLKNDEVVRGWARGMADRAKEEMRKNGTQLEGVGIYGNFAQELPAAEIFGVNFERLRELKTKYDPDNLFNKVHPIPPLH